MPVNTTVSHVSPLLSYIPRSAWYEGGADDPDLLNYPNWSYHATNNTASGNASVTFSWWGTGIWIHGGYRTWSGEYEVTLDGETTSHAGYADGSEEDFDRILFSASALPAGHHHIRLRNASKDPRRPVLHFDYIVFENPLSDGGTVGHTNPLCDWFPHGAWAVDEASHSTSNSLGGVEISFAGSGIVLYGHVNETTAPLSISVDGRASQLLPTNTAVSPLVDTAQVLFAIGGLDEDNHVLRVENNPREANASAQRMDIMYSQIFTSARSDNGLTQPTGPSSNKDPIHDPHSRVIFAAGFGSLGALFLAILIWRLVVRYKHKVQLCEDKLVPRPFLARTHPPLSPHSPSHPQDPRTPDTPGPGPRATYLFRSARAHESRRFAPNPSIGRLNQSLSRARRPPSVTIPIKRYQDVEAYAQLDDEANTEPSDSPPGARGESSGAGPGQALGRHPTTGTTNTSRTSRTLCDDGSLDVNPPFSPHYPSVPLPLAMSLSMSPRSAVAPGSVPVPLTLPLRVGGRRFGRRGSTEKPPLGGQGGREGRKGRDAQYVVVGSPVGSSLPSSRVSQPQTLRSGTLSGAPPLPPPPLPPLPPPPLPASARLWSVGPPYEYDVEMVGPPPYRPR